MNKKKLFYNDAELTKSGIAIAKLMNKANKKGKRNGEHKDK